MRGAGRTRRGDYTARKLSGEERARWWLRALAVWPAYDGDAQMAARVIPILLLEPISAHLEGE